MPVLWLSICRLQDAGGRDQQDVAFFASPSHASAMDSGKKDHKQFRCIECIPAVLLYNAVACSGSGSELAKAIIARRRNERQPAFEIRDPNSFLEEHELVREESGETLERLPPSL